MDELEVIPLDPKKIESAYAESQGITSQELQRRRENGLCTKCGDQYQWGINVFTEAGARDTRIINMCERCFDGLFGDEEDEEGEQS
jgi:hypothetical protein